MDKTYAVYAEEYYFDMNILSTVLKKKVYSVSYNEKLAEEIKHMIHETLQRSIDSAKVNANNEMLTTYKIGIICIEGKLSIDEVGKCFIDDDYTWGKIYKRR